MRIHNFIPLFHLLSIYPLINLTKLKIIPVSPQGLILTILLNPNQNLYIRVSPVGRIPTMRQLSFLNVSLFICFYLVRLFSSIAVARTQAVRFLWSQLLAFLNFISLALPSRSRSMKMALYESHVKPQTKGFGVQVELCDPALIRE